jgi:hypothetical protein
MCTRSVLGIALLLVPVIALGDNGGRKETIGGARSCQADGWWAAKASPYLRADRLAGRAAGEDRPAPRAVLPLRHSHAHNDYEHQRPLLDALDCGFCSVEADVFLKDGRLLVSHTPFALKPDRTLESLYLDPLCQRAKANGGRVYRDGPPLFLLVDVKTEANPTSTALDKVLARYADLVSVVRHGKFEERAVTVVVSGNRASEVIAGQPVRYAGLDGRLTDLDATVPAHLMPWISERWTKEFHWQGEGPMPEAERAKLQEIVQKAHRHGRLVRFWATPEKVEVWKELRAAGVDLINTDQLPEMQRFLLGSTGPASRP